MNNSFSLIKGSLINRRNESTVGGEQINRKFVKKLFGISTGNLLFTQEDWNLL